MVHSKRCHSSAPFLVIPVLDTGIQLLCNLIKNVCFSVRQLPLAHQLSYKQNFWIPVSSTGMTSSVVQFTFKNEYPYSYVLGTEMASFFIC
ncbi:MAG: hypothetical protein O7150_05045 [Wolbachia endosymbiont of Andrena praecox]|uniref:hypothetical protein n=1 Tax=unclassified Wolbachia TaxID=2640676 RepID=UPI001BD3E442|nr:hypothetical protein [Wolbachia endosymbiont of Rhagoletis cerasi]MBS9530121.1 hypothetical protein [Wolbachia endosymbiont of Rhagoletis cerasi]MDX5488122.1 hypothetical protein [Wolbachia endosymbiont of Andrena praecox]MEC4735536.1 hypothetical protein [Wolbachia endosymbiont of Halictus tumulorum]